MGDIQTNPAQFFTKHCLKALVKRDKGIERIRPRIFQYKRNTHLLQVVKVKIPGGIRKGGFFRGMKNCILEMEFFSIETNLLENALDLFAVTS